MNIGIQHLVKAVMRSLEVEVLPHLDPQTTPASNVRACLTLLANIETRVAHEAQVVGEDNRELRPLLQDCIERAAKIGLDSATCDAVRSALAPIADESQSGASGMIAAENRRLQEALTTVINALPMAVGDRAAKGEFRSRLHQYLAATSQREMQLAESGLARMPV